MGLRSEPAEATEPSTTTAETAPALRRPPVPIDERYVRWCAEYCLHLARSRAS